MDFLKLNYMLLIREKLFLLNTRIKVTQQKKITY